MGWGFFLPRSVQRHKMETKTSFGFSSLLGFVSVLFYERGMDSGFGEGVCVNNTAQPLGRWNVSLAFLGAISRTTHGEVQVCPQISFDQELPSALTGIPI